MPGERVLVAEVCGGWARLVGCGLQGEELWMLLDGSTLGLGVLLERAPSWAPAAAKGGRGREEEEVVVDDDEGDDDEGDFGG